MAAASVSPSAPRSTVTLVHAPADHREATGRCATSRQAGFGCCQLNKGPQLEGRGPRPRQGPKIAQRQRHCQRSEKRNEACSSAAAAVPGRRRGATGSAPAYVPPARRHVREASHTMGWNTVRLASWLAEPSPWGWFVQDWNTLAKFASLPLSPM